MKKSFLFVLAASLVCNAVLAFFLIRGATAAGDDSAPVATAPATVSGGSDSPAIDATIWPSLQSTDLSTLLARLRATGFPLEITRAILAAQINETFAARRKALDPDAETRPYWKNRPPNEQALTTQRQLAREQQKALRDLLGDDADATDPMSLAYQQRRLGGVPADKLPEIRQLLRDYDERRSDLYSGGPMLPSDREKQVALDFEQQTAIAKILTPAEFAEYSLRSSNTASSLRYQLANFEPTEQEFRTLFQLQYPFDEQYRAATLFYGGTPTPEQRQLMTQRNEAQKQLTEQIKAALGPARAEEYTRATDYNYRQTSQLVARLELPPETAGQIYAVQQDIQQRTTALQTDRTLAPAARTQQLAALAEEAQAKIAPMLGGTRGMEAYKQNGGQWLQNLVPRPAPVPVRN